MNPTNEPPLRIGLVMNPEAGLGGRIGLKGSDGAEVKAKAKAAGATGQSHNRVE